MKLKIKCDWCGKEFERYQSQINGKRHLFCSKACLASYSNKSKNPEGYSLLKDLTGVSLHMTKLNLKLNPTRMNAEVRAKLRESRVSEENGRTYAKYYGEKVHRMVAEQIIGRPLKPGEVVHHIDGNKRNNNPENLLVLTASEHSRIHGKLNGLWSYKRFKEGDNA